MKGYKLDRKLEFGEIKEYPRYCEFCEKYLEDDEIILIENDFDMELEPCCKKHGYSLTE